MEANYAYYALFQFHIRPSEWAEMDSREKAFLIAASDIMLENEKKARKKNR